MALKTTQLLGLHSKMTNYLNIKANFKDFFFFLFLFFLNHLSKRDAKEMNRSDSKAPDCFSPSSPEPVRPEITLFNSHNTSQTAEQSSPWMTVVARIKFSLQGPQEQNNGILFLPAAGERDREREKLVLVESESSLRLISDCLLSLKLILTQRTGTLTSAESDGSVQLVKVQSNIINIKEIKCRKASVVSTFRFTL